MKTYKIFAVPSHQTVDRTSGVDFARVLQPMKYLNGYEDGEVRFEVDFYDIHAKKQASWPEIAKKYDLVFLNYTVLDWQYAAMGACVHGEGKKIVMDLDDAIWFIRKDNVVSEQIEKLDGPYILSCILDDVDGVTTTNGYLRNIIIDKTYRRNDQIRVMENQVDLTLYNRVFPAKDTGEITLMHFGSTSHFDDLLDKEFIDGMDRILKKYPQVKFKTVGAFISKLRYKWGNRYINAFGDVDIYKWIQNKFPEYMAEADIMVVPLEDDKYNRSKSDIKFLESGSAGVPGVFSSTRPYNDTIRHGVNGFLASTSDEWFNYLSQLIESVELRKKIGTAAYEYVKEKRQIQDHVKEYANYFRQILEAN